MTSGFARFIRPKLSQITQTVRQAYHLRVATHRIHSHSVRDCATNTVISIDAHTRRSWREISIDLWI